MKKTVRNGKIELLRFVLCMIIMLMHSSTFTPDGVRNLFKIRGGLGVEFFFMVSGYLLACTAAKRQQEPIRDLGRETHDFIARKIMALMPNFLIAWCIGFAVMCVRNGTYTPVGIAKYIADCIWEPIFIHMAGFGRSRVNGVDWYISVMLLCMLVIYPLCRRFFSVFTRIAAPTCALFLLGYLCYATKSIMTPTGYMGFVYKGVIRGFAEICIGAALYPLIQWLMGLRLTRFAKAGVSLAETALWTVIIGYMAFSDYATYDFVVILLIGAAVVLAFSHQGLFAARFDTPLCAWLGRFSLSLYLGHVYWGRLLGTKFPNGDYFTLMCMYVPLALATALVIHASSDALRKRSGAIFGGMKKLLLEQKGETNQ